MQVAMVAQKAFRLLILVFTVGGVSLTPLSPAPTTPVAMTPPPDPCEGRPCLNGGVCAPQPDVEGTLENPPDSWAYICTCTPGFTGHNCEFFADPCASSPCVHGNCSRGDEAEVFTCECSEGFGGDRCDQPKFDPNEPIWDVAENFAPEHATPATPVTPTTATQTTEPTTVPSTTQAPPTLLPWLPKAGQRFVEVQWDDEQVRDGSGCGTSGMLTVSLEVAEDTDVKILVNVSGAPVLWRVGVSEFATCSLVGGSVIPPLQAPDGLVLPDASLRMGQDYFIGVLRLGTPEGPEVALRLHITRKASSCVEPGSSFSDPQCSGKGKCITQPSVDTFYCECDDGFTGIFCEEYDACHHKPCENNGTCADLRQGGQGRNFTCSCQPGFEGDRCHALVDHCLSQPCRNGASCSSSLGGPHCYCPEGYQGSLCEQKVDPCASSPCHNNGSCVAQAGGSALGFSCTCPQGFTGPTCAQLVDFCALNPCAHGICRNVGTSYRCLCVPGYHGLYCEEEYNECLSAPCQNYATCRDLINAYECVCTPQYDGRHCEIYKDPCLKVHCQNGGHCESAGLNGSCVCPPGYLGQHCEIDINECESNPCHHGGTCINQSNGYACHCPPGWVGGNCEIHLQWKPAHPDETLTNMPRHSLYIIIGALCVAFVLMLIILIVGICRISRIEYQGSSRHAYQEFYNCRSIDSDFSNAIANIRHARFGKKSRPAMYDATPIAYEDYSPDDKPLVTLIKTKDL
ncbi:delta and Notch-like epidermal growth factor-related receptor isoform X1 [Clupea harengus]|uniref:Delta and Notch-like epidermal growth factor-related receptor isoform X1 n=1 Tax=Clupea harengus TaxID=7950 RepID=A0A6P8G243_CLUHA|nr:delta and Notch-like epidermal growth factor-related receptor isoform X1 [Clupea harengus]